MDSDSLNLAIRIMFQQEVERFHNTNYLGWRHFINQDFGVTLHAINNIFLSLIKI